MIIQFRESDLNHRQVNEIVGTVAAAVTSKDFPGLNAYDLRPGAQDRLLAVLNERSIPYKTSHGSVESSHNGASW